jgi:transcriptional regulator with XRE-family HTH domain
MSQQHNDLPASKEARLQLALQAIQRDATLTQRRAAAIYNVSQSTLSDRRAGKTFRPDCTPNSMKLLKTEEDVIVEHILDLDARGWPPQLTAVKEMADSLLTERHRDPVGQNWAKSFVKRRPELQVKFNRKYNYRRALYEDPEAIRG